MDNSNEVAFDRELRSIVERYSHQGLLSAGEIIAVIEFVKHATIHAAENATAETKIDNFTPTNSGITPCDNNIDVPLWYIIRDRIQPLFNEVCFKMEADEDRVRSEFVTAVNNLTRTEK